MKKFLSNVIWKFKCISYIIQGYPVIYKVHFLDGIHISGEHEYICISDVSITRPSTEYAIRIGK